MRVGWTGDVVAAQENRTGNLSGGRYRRYLAKTQLTLRNLDVKGSFTF